MAEIVYERSKTAQGDMKTFRKQERLEGPSSYATKGKWGRHLTAQYGSL